MNSILPASFRLFLAALFFFSAPVDALAQGAAEAVARIRFVNLNFVDQPIARVVADLNILSRDADPRGEGVKVVLLDPDRVNHRVTLSVQGVSFRAAMDLILRGSDLEYHVEQRVVVIEPRKDLAPAAASLPVPNTKGGELITARERGAIFTIKVKDTVSVVTQTGYGTGFLADIRGRRMLVTNLHVVRGVAGLESLEVKNVKGDTLKLGRVWGAVDHDLAIIEVLDQPEGQFAFTFRETVGDLSRGERIVIVGNPQGEGTILESQGSVQGVGPTTVEYDAATFPGNSGSPVIELSSRQVLAVHTMAKPVNLTTLAATEAASRRDSPLHGGVRRFGTRLDTVKRWEEIQWREWVRQDQQLLAYWNRLIAFDALAGGTHDPFRGPSLQRIMRAQDLWSAFERYEAEWTRNNNPQEREAAARRVINLVNSIYGPDAALASEIRRSRRAFYSFYAEELEDIENALAAINVKWREHQTEVLHSFRLHRERGMR